MEGSSKKTMRIKRDNILPGHWIPVNMHTLSHGLLLGNEVPRDGGKGEVHRN